MEHPGDSSLWELVSEVIEAVKAESGGVCALLVLVIVGMGWVVRVQQQEKQRAFDLIDLMLGTAESNLKRLQKARGEGDVP